MKLRIAVLVTVSTLLLIAGCKDKTSEGKFVVEGKLENASAKMIYLEELPAATMQRIMVDSATIGDDGKYKLKAESGQASVYTLRLDQQAYPMASVINDVNKITLDARFGKGNSQFAEDYMVKGSKASQYLKDFMVDFNNELQQLFMLNRQHDSLTGASAGDSVLGIIESQKNIKVTSIHDRMMRAINKSENPALTMYVLGYYQTTANNPGFGLPPLGIEEVKKIVDDTNTKFPEHSGVLAIKNSIDQQFQPKESSSNSWVGKQAPEFSLPDINGKEVKLSSLKGKYVLVDFWASWCKPCRHENPNVVKAFNRFKDKNFTIIGVSLDKEKGPWLQAISEDKLTWQHVSDLKYWQSQVTSLYNLEGIPYNVLLDPTGKIVAEGLRGEQLEQKLAEYLN